MRQDTAGDGARRIRQTTTGLLLIAAGVLVFMAQQGIVQLVSIWLYWPVVLIATGLVKVVTPRPGRDLASGTLEVLTGGWFLACNLHWLGFTYRQTWPLIFVAIGLSQIIKALGGAPSPPTVEAKENDHA